MLYFEFKYLAICSRPDLASLSCRACGTLKRSVLRLPVFFVFSGNMSDVFGLEMHRSEKVLLILERRETKEERPERESADWYDLYSDL